MKGMTAPTASVWFRLRAEFGSLTITDLNGLSMKYETTKGNGVDRAWLACLIVVGGVLSAYLSTTIFDVTVLLSGILCVGLIAVGRREGYLIGLYNSLAYSILAYANGLYGEVYLNLLFFVPTGVIGYVMWSRHTRQDKTVEMRQLGWQQRVAVSVFCFVFTIGLGYLLGLNPRQNSPYLDATTNVLSVVATFLMILRFKEQWLLYILLNVITICMWLMRFDAGGPSGDLMILMWSLFLLNALFGYWRWHTGANSPRDRSSRLKAEEEGACGAA